MPKRIKTSPPKGGKKVSDWIGKRVVNIRDFESYSQKMPANSFGTVTDAGNGCGLRITFDKCECCGLQAIFTGVDSRDLREVDTTI